MYDILERGGAVRTRSYPARLPHYSTVRAHHRAVGPKSGHLSNTQANAEHGGEGVAGGFAADRRLGGSGGGCWVLIPKGRRVVLFVSEDVSHALRGLCEGVSLLSPCY